MRISDLSTDVCSAERRPAGPAGLRGEIKEEASAAGGCRGTFATKACRSRRARQVATRRAIGQEAGNPSRSSVKRSEEHTSELQSLMRISYAVFCLKKKKKKQITQTQLPKNKKINQTKR